MQVRTIPVASGTLTFTKGTTAGTFSLTVPVGQFAAQPNTILIFPKGAEEHKDGKFMNLTATNWNVTGGVLGIGLDVANTEFELGKDYSSFAAMHEEDVKKAKPLSNTIDVKFGDKPDDPDPKSAFSAVLSSLAVLVCLVAFVL